MDHPRHVVAVCGLFQDDQDRVLLVKTSYRAGWECPGGQVELGEDLVAALLREVAEETGCRVSVERLVGVYSRTDPPHIVNFMFRGRLLAGSPTTDQAEITETGLFAPGKALELVTAPQMRLRLQDALAQAERPVYRVYQRRPYQEFACRSI